MTTEGDLQNMEEKSSLISFPEEVRKGPTWEGGGLGKVREGGKKKEIGGMMIDRVDNHRVHRVRRVHRVPGSEIRHPRFRK